MKIKAIIEWIEREWSAKRGETQISIKYENFYIQWWYLKKIVALREQENYSLSSHFFNSTCVCVWLWTLMRLVHKNELGDMLTGVMVRWHRGYFNFIFQLHIAKNNTKTQRSLEILSCKIKFLLHIEFCFFFL